MTELNDNEYSEPIELFFHDADGSRLANVAFDVAAKIYNLEPEKHFNKDYFIGYMRLSDEVEQQGVKNRLFKQSADLVRTLVHYKTNVLSEPGDTAKVNLKDLRDALKVIDTFY